MSVLKETHFTFPGQTSFYRGKVRDVYTINHEYLVTIVSDRISAFDYGLPEPIPYKGQILNLLAARALQATASIVPNWLITVPDPNVSIGRVCTPFKIEMIIRAYLSGYAWRAYQAKKRIIAGIQLPPGLKENDRLPQPIITPSIKVASGHDMTVSKEAILSKGIISEEDYQQLEKYTYALFQKGTEIAAEHDLILVDSKYEFGKSKGQIYLIDEIHTPDASRYFYQKYYERCQENHQEQKQLSKEFVRKWLISKGFMGKQGQKLPKMTQDVVTATSECYIELFEQLACEKFVKTEIAMASIEKNILAALAALGKMLGAHALGK